MRNLLFVCVTALFASGCFLENMPAENPQPATRIERVVTGKLVPAAEVFITSAEQAEPVIRALEDATGRMITSEEKLARAEAIAKNIERTAAQVAAGAAFLTPTPLSPIAGPVGAIAGLIGTIAAGMFGFLQRRKAKSNEKVAVAVMTAVEKTSGIGKLIQAEGIKHNNADNIHAMYESNLANIQRV